MTLMLLLFTLTLTANAGSPAYYHPDDVAAKSERFRSAASKTAPDFEKAQSDLSRLGKQMEQMELAVSMLGDQAPESLKMWSAETQRTVNGQYLQIQRHVDLLQEDFSTIFGDALNRALIPLGTGTDVEECSPGGGISSMMRRGNASGGCEGADLNPTLARALDQDPQLAAALDEIYGIPYPPLGVTPKEQPSIPLTGSGKTVQLALVARVFMNDRITQRLEVFEASLAPLERELSANESSAIEEAASLKAAYAQALAEDGQVLQDAMAASLSKAAKKEPMFGEIALCANPEALGGCSGEDVTREVVAFLKSDRRFQKAQSRF
ncbi:MAG: hypothetical protein AAFV53_25470 [Myxococcota bacterium]